MAKKVKEIQFSTTDRVGVLSRITGALKQARVNIEHVSACSEGRRAYFSLVTNNNARARQALRKIGIRSSEGEALLLNLQNRPGSLERVAKRLARAGINISCLAATTAGKRASVLLNTNNNRKAQRLV